MPGSAHRSVSFNLAGWLWADLLLGMFAIFLAANALAPRGAPRGAARVDPRRRRPRGRTRRGARARSRRAPQHARDRAGARHTPRARSRADRGATTSPGRAARSAARRRAEAPRPLEA